MRKRISIPLLASFLVPLFISLFVCVKHEVYPFGEQCILHVDMYHQYCPFFTELMGKLKDGGSLLYSWNVGLGVDFVSLYAYYLASPLNWLIVLCPSGHVIEFMTVLVLLKTALCGLTFAYYLKGHFGTAHPAISVFGTAYALSAFMAAYAWNIMWTDCMVLVPLIILGLERLMRDGRPALYYVTLSLCILCNYYISIMVCIFLVLWFLVCWLLDRGTGIRAWLRFAGYSLLAGGTGAVLILPTAVVLGYSGAQGSDFPETLEWYFNILSELARHCVLTEAYTGGDHWPNLYCGVFVLVFFVLFLLNREISWKKRLAYFLLVALFAVSFAFNVLDCVWHGLHFPTSLPGRQTFLYIFVLLTLSFETFLHLKGNRMWHVVVTGAANILFLLAAYKVTDGDVVEEKAFAVTAVLVECYLLLVAGYLAGNGKIKKLMLSLGCFTMLMELLVNYEATGLDVTGRTSYVAALGDYKTVLAEAADEMQEQGILFYRTDEIERKTKNDAALSGYRSATQFSSLMNLNVSHFYQDVGMEGGLNFYCVNGATPLFAAMLGIRYVLADNSMESGPLRTLAASSGDTYLYENAYVLPLGFMMGEDVIASWDQDAGDIEAQNGLAYLLGAETQMLSPVPSSSQEGESVVEIEKDGYYYATYASTSVDNLTEEVSDGRTRSFTKVSHGYTLDLGYCKAGATVRIKNSSSETLDITAYYLDLDAVDAAYRTLAAQTLELDTFTDTRIEGTIEVKEAGRLIFSIADEEGWTLLVDGEETEPEDFGGAFLSTYLEEGQHEIALRYRTPRLALGAVISCASLAAFVIVMWLKRRREAAAD